MELGEEIKHKTIIKEYKVKNIEVLKETVQLFNIRKSSAKIRCLELKELKIEEIGEYR